MPFILDRLVSQILWLWCDTPIKHASWSKNKFSVDLITTGLCNSTFIFASFWLVEICRGKNMEWFKNTPMQSKGWNCHVDFGLFINVGQIITIVLTKQCQERSKYCHQISIKL